MPELRIDVDISGLLEFDAKLARLEAEAERIASEILRELGARLMRATREKTPVDTGLLRRSWALGDIQVKGSVLELELSNNVEYAEFVEYGHAQEVGRFVPAIGKRLVVPLSPGFFMLTRSEEELKAVLPDLVRARMEAYLREVLE